MYRSKLNEKLQESLAAVLPILAIVLILSFTIAPLPTSVLMAFLFGAVLLVVGMMFFSLGAELAMSPMGERVGACITKTRRVGIMLTLGFLLGFLITISEPDLQVLANQVQAVPNMVLIVTVAVGVGLFLCFAMLRMLLSVPLNTMLVGFYIVVFVLAMFVPKDFLAVAFDSGGVTTGPMTVPFIMAMGVGVSAIRSDKHSANDSFGLVALCSIGPILAVLILSLIFRPDGGSYTPVVIPEIGDSAALWQLFFVAFPTYFKEIAVSLLPIAAFFAVFDLVSLHLERKQLIRIGVGLAYTYLGLVIFLTGVNVGFMPAGNYLGSVIAGLSCNWIIIPIGMLIGSRALERRRVDGADRRRDPRQRDEAFALHRRSRLGRSCDDPRADRHFHLLPARAGLRRRHRALVLRAEALHRHRVRLRRRGLGPHGDDLPAALCDGRVLGGRRQYRHRRLRRGRHGRHDAAHHHPGAWTALSSAHETRGGRERARGLRRCVRLGRPRHHRPVRRAQHE